MQQRVGIAADRFGGSSELLELVRDTRSPVHQIGCLLLAQLKLDVSKPVGELQWRVR